MTVALIVIALFVALAVVIAIRTARLPKRAGPEPDSERLRDPTLTSHKGGGGAGG